MDEADYVVVGSGINGLVCAAMLALKGRSVRLLERNDRIGGCIRTEAITRPGFVHDVMATTFVLFITSPAFAALGPELTQRGLAFAQSDVPTGVLRPDGRSLVLTRSREQNVAAFEAAETGDGAAFDREMQGFGRNAGFVFALLGGRLWSSATLRMVARELWQRGPRGLAGFLGEALVTARAHLTGRYRSSLVRDLFAPWVLHTGLGPESAYSGEMLKVIGFALEAAGAPIVQGGAGKLLEAFERLIRDKGGIIETGADVTGLRRDARGRATGVVLADGRTVAARRGVICSMAPDQLYGRLLKGVDLPSEITDGLARYQYGKANMQIHYALSAPPRWPTAELGRVALLHLTPGLDGVSRAANEAERGMLPAEPTICVGPAERARPEPGAGRPGRALAAAARGAARHQGRRGRRDRGPCRRPVDAGDPGGLRGPGRGHPGPAHRRVPRHRAGATQLLAGRPRGHERQPRRRRPLRRFLRARPVLPLAAPSRAASIIRRRCPASTTSAHPPTRGQASAAARASCSQMRSHDRSGQRSPPARGSDAGARWRRRNRRVGARQRP